MDPDATMSELISNLRDGADVELALGNALDLLEWLAKDGAKPSAFTIKLQTARRHLDAILDAVELDEDEDEDEDDDV